MKMNNSLLQKKNKMRKKCIFKLFSQKNGQLVNPAYNF